MIKIILVIYTAFGNGELGMGNWEWGIGQAEKIERKKLAQLLPIPHSLYPIIDRALKNAGSA